MNCTILDGSDTYTKQRYKVFNITSNFILTAAESGFVIGCCGIFMIVEVVVGRVAETFNCTQINME